MFWLYLALGVLLVAALNGALRYLAGLPHKRFARIMRWVMIGALALLALIALRFGLPYLSGAIAGLLGLWALVSRASALIGLWRFVSSRTRNSKRAETSSPSSSLSVEDACEMLGVSRDASVEEIKQAHRALMHKLHPDKGGNEYLARQLNQAKDLLLAHKNKA